MTNGATRAEDRTAARRRMMRRRRRTVTGLLAVVLAGAAYVIACAVAPLPQPRVDLEAQAEREVVAEVASAEALVASQTLPTAIGWAHDDGVWTNDDTPYPLGSVTKLITVLVCLEAQPLEPGADGPTYVWTAEDRARQDYYLSLQGVAYPIPVGTEITMRQMLQFIFLPSSNDYAYAYAMWVFGDNETFLEALEQFKEKHGLHSINLVEPTGMDDLDRANAADLVRVARLAIENPTVREFNGMQSAEMPWGIGLIENTNPLLGEVPGMIGVKTGMLSTVGYNFVAAQQIDALGREVISISVTLARPSSAERAESGRTVLELMAGLPQQVPLVAEGERIGTLTTVTGDVVPLVTAADSGTVMLPGETSSVTVRLDPPPTAGDSGMPVGAVTASSPTGSVDVPVVTTAAVEEPDLWWRLTHPAQLFGWAS